MVHSRTTVHVATPNFDDTWQPFCHHGCLCNEEIAIRNRVLAEMPQPTEEGLEELKAAAKLLSTFLPTTSTADYGSMPNLYTGQKRKRYLRAEEYVQQHGIDKSMSSIKMFVKNDKLDPIKVNPDPRPIQFRDARYCVEISRYLKPMEHNLYNLEGDESVGLSPTRLVGKGLNQVQRAKLLKHKLSLFLRPAILSLDCARFDLHVSLELLEIEHSVYLAANPDPAFAKLLSWQLRNTCYSQNGIKYVTRGRRMSGDMNTALGNCIIMIIMVMAFMKRFGVHYDILDDGDDCLLIVEAENVTTIRESVHGAFLSYGHEVKIEKVAYSLPEVSWCQSSPIEYAAGKWKFVRNPWKVMSCDLVGVRWKVGGKGRARMLATVGVCELILNLGVPVLQSYSLALIRNAGNAKIYEKGDYFQSSVAQRAKKELRVFGLKHITKLKPGPITMEARLSFEAAFNIPIEMQLVMEKDLDSWVIQLEGTAKQGEPRDPHTWHETRPCYPERYL